MSSYTLPDLQYDYGALEPHISGKIMELHHDKHHAGYVKGANETLEKLDEARHKEEFTRLGALDLVHRAFVGRDEKGRVTRKENQRGGGESYAAPAVQRRLSTAMSKPCRRPAPSSGSTSMSRARARPYISTRSTFRSGECWRNWRPRCSRECRPS